VFEQRAQPPYRDRVLEVRSTGFDTALALVLDHRPGWRGLPTTGSEMFHVKRGVRGPDTALARPLNHRLGWRAYSTTRPAVGFDIAPGDYSTAVARCFT
jgi:hypothetical protein